MGHPETLYPFDFFLLLLLLMFIYPAFIVVDLCVTTVVFLLLLNFKLPTAGENKPRGKLRHIYSSNFAVTQKKINCSFD